jgi:hypothetical protein
MQISALFKGISSEGEGGTPNIFHNFDFQKSRMAICCNLRVIFMQKATKNCVVGGK